MRNGYTVKILNKLHQPREFDLAVRGLAPAPGRHHRHGNKVQELASQPTICADSACS